MKSIEEDLNEVYGEVEEGLEIKGRGATSAFYNSDGEKLSRGFHTVWKMDDGRYIGKKGGKRYILDVSEDGVEELNDGDHSIQRTSSGYKLKTGARSRHIDYDGNPSNPVRNRAPSLGLKKTAKVTKKCVKSMLRPRESSKEELKGIKRILKGVEKYNDRKNSSYLQKIKTVVSNYAGKEKKIKLDGATSVNLDVDEFEEFFSPLIREYTSNVDYGGPMDEDIHQALMEDIIEKNEVRIESCIGEGEERTPEVIAYDVGDGIVYEGHIHLLTDIKKPYGEEPMDLVGDREEQEFEVRVKVSYDKAAELPDPEKDPEEAEEQLFEREVAYT